MVRAADTVRSARWEAFNEEPIRVDRGPDPAAGG